MTDGSWPRLDVVGRTVGGVVKGREGEGRRWQENAGLRGFAACRGGTWQGSVGEQRQLTRAQPESPQRRGLPAWLEFSMPQFLSFGVHTLGAVIRLEIARVFDLAGMKRRPEPIKGGSLFKAASRVHPGSFLISVKRLTGFG